VPVMTTTKPKNQPMLSELLQLPCASEAIDAARANFYRPPIVRLVTRGRIIARFAVSTGACPLKVVRRIGFAPVRLLLHRGALGEVSRPDELVFEVHADFVLRKCQD
jgi:hypothetical protein